MQRPNIAPRYVNIEMKVVMDQDLTAPAKLTYMYLKALACGSKETAFSIEEFLDLFSMSRSTLYRHLSDLSQRGVLHFASFGDVNRGFVHVAFLIDQSLPWYATE